MFLAARYVESDTNKDGASGRVLKELKVRRADLVLTTKIFWGTRAGPNNMGLSRKQWGQFMNIHVLTDILATNSIVEGVKESLERLGVDYVDIVFAHRPDHTGRASNNFELVSKRDYSPHTGDCPRVLLDHRARLGTGNCVLRLSTVLILLYQAYYWGTSEWSAREIEEACRESKLQPTVRNVLSYGASPISSCRTIWLTRTSCRAMPPQVSHG